LSTFFLGFALYGSGYLLTTYLARAQGYNAQQIGAVVMWTGLPQLLIIPFVPKMQKYIDGRVLVGGGLLLFAVSCLMNLWLSRDTAADQLLIPNVIRALGMSVVLAPLSGLAMAGIERHNAGAASGLFNMMRNLGGAFGTAALLTFFTKREQYHSNVINSHVTTTDPATQERLVHLQNFFLQHGSPDPVAAGHEAVIAIGRAVHQQAVLMGFGDTFAMLGVVLIFGAASIALLKKSSGAAAAGAH
jgi:DHA2 family multidrug resistance protein